MRPRTSTTPSSISLYDPPSYGPKHALLVVDSHYWPLEWEGMGTSEAHLRLNSRSQPGNATFTLQKTTPYTVRRADAAGNILETKTFRPLPAVSQFHDSLGYYPGLRYRPANDGLYFWDAAASLVVPAKGNYTTKITDGDKTPLLVSTGSTWATRSSARAIPAMTRCSTAST